jgi:hypothetical protein
MSVVRRLASSTAEVVGHGWRKYIVWKQRINAPVEAVTTGMRLDSVEIKPPKLAA